MKVLLTGASGQLARLVALDLARDGVEVVGLDLRPTRPRDFPGPFERVRRYDHRDVSEVLRIHQPDTLLHLGVRAGGFQAQARQRYTQNVLGTRYLLQSALDRGVKRAVVLGTYHVYGAHPNNPTFLREDAPLRAVQDFPEILDVVELDHTVTGFLWRHRSMPTVLLRPVNLVGPHLTNQVTTLLRGRTCPRLLGYNPMLQFLHESDAVRAIRAALDLDEPGVYNIAGEGAIPWLEAIQCAGSRPVSLPHLLAYPVVRFLSSFNVAFPEHLMDFFRYPVIVSDEAFREKTSWEPMISVVDALRSIADVPHDARDARDRV